MATMDRLSICSYCVVVVVGVEKNFHPAHSSKMFLNVALGICVDIVYDHV